MTEQLKVLTPKPWWAEFSTHTSQASLQMPTTPAPRVQEKELNQENKDKVRGKTLPQRKKVGVIEYWLSSSGLWDYAQEKCEHLLASVLTQTDRSVG